MEKKQDTIISSMAKTALHAMQEYLVKLEANSSTESFISLAIHYNLFQYYIKAYPQQITNDIQYIEILEKVEGILKQTKYEI